MKWGCPLFAWSKLAQSRALYLVKSCTLGVVASSLYVERGKIKARAVHLGRGFRSPSVRTVARFLAESRPSCEACGLRYPHGEEDAHAGECVG